MVQAGSRIEAAIFTNKNMGMGLGMKTHAAIGLMIFLRPCRISLFRIHAQVGKGFLRLFGIKFTVSGQT